MVWCGGVGFCVVVIFGAVWSILMQYVMEKNFYRLYYLVLLRSVLWCCVAEVVKSIKDAILWLQSY